MYIYVYKYVDIYMYIYTYTYIYIYIYILLVGGGAAFIAYRENRKLKNLEKGKKALEDLMKEVVEAGENKDFLSESCPVIIVHMYMYMYACILMLISLRSDMLGNFCTVWSMKLI
jgi:hypothetical protein